MSPIQKATFYAAECDACGDTPEEYDNVTHWSDQDTALEMVENADGMVLNREGYDIFVLCESCRAEYCTTFPDYEEGGDSNLHALDAVRDGDEPQTAAARAWAAERLAAKTA